MCSIIAAMGYTPHSLKWEQGLAVMSHRGPDGEGLFCDQQRKVLLAHGRLAIMDPPRGQQPLLDKTGQYILVCNGEVYDFERQRQELIALGCEFATDSDSEVLLQGYIQFGDKFIDKIRGEFAFALYDRHLQRLLVGRDRFGVKPMYYIQTPQGWVFSSEVKAFFAMELTSPAIDIHHIRSMMSYIPVDTIFRGIHTLPPGYLGEIRPNGELTTWSYWMPQLGQLADSIPDETTAKNCIREGVDEVVRLRMRADVPVGVYLSGGIDSCAVAATAARQSPQGQSIKAFHAQFTDDQSFNETSIAEKMAHHIGADFYGVPCDFNTLLEHFPQSLWHAETPTANLHGAAKYLVAQKASQHVKVVLTGEGADEIFLGYDYFRNQGRGIGHQFTQGRVYQRRHDAKTRQRIEKEIGFLPMSDLLRSLSPKTQQRMLQLLHPRHRDDFKLQHPLEVLKKSLDGLIDHTDNLLSQQQFFSLRTMMPRYHLAHVGDRQDMAHSVEGRPPFLDHQFFAMCTRIPHHLKIQGREKYIFREAMEDRVLAEIAQGKKWPFSAPMFLFKQGFLPILDDYIHEYLSPKAIEQAGIFYYPSVRRLLILNRLPGLTLSLRQRLNGVLTFILSVQILEHSFRSLNSYHQLAQQNISPTLQKRVLI